MLRGSLSMIRFLQAFVFVVGASVPLQSQVVVLGVDVSEVSSGDRVSDGGTVMGAPGSVLQLDVVSFVDTDQECLQGVHMNLAAAGPPVLGFAVDGFDKAAAQTLIGHELYFFSLTPRNGLCITPDRCPGGLVSYGAILPVGAGDGGVLEPGKTEVLKLRLDIRVPEDFAGERVVLQFEDLFGLELSPLPQRNHVICDEKSLVPFWNAFSVQVLPYQGSLPGDITGNALLDISDPLALLSWLFIAPPSRTPCEGSLSDPGSSNRRHADANGDGVADITDAIHLLFRLFLGGPPHVLGSECTEIDGCRQVCSP